MAARSARGRRGACGLPRRAAPLPPLLLLLGGGRGDAADPEAPSLYPRSMTRLLNDGTEMPVVGLGTWKAKAGEVEQAVYYAICRAGYRHIDAAQIYQNQEQVGEAIARAIADCGVRREELWVTSKIWMTDFHPNDIPAAVDRILHELGLTYVDQLLLHWPFAYAKPPPGCPPACPASLAGTDDPMRPRDANGGMVHADVPLSDTWEALLQQKAAGKVRSVGVSNFSPAEIAQLRARPDAALPAVNQVEAHIFWNQAKLREEMSSLGITVVAYTPLGNAPVYGNKYQGMSSELVAGVAEETGLTPAQVMLNFLLAQDMVVVPKSVTPSRIDSNINFRLSLTRAHIDKLVQEAPQLRLANPPNRPGGKPVFDDMKQVKRDGEL